MSFDESVNKILHEQYYGTKTLMHGGSPNQQATGIKRHVGTMLENTGNMAKELQDRFAELAPYYSRDPEDIRKFGKSPNAKYTEDKNAIEGQDKVVKELLGDSELMKVDIQQGGGDGDVHVYALRDDRLVDSLKPLGMVAMSYTDHGMETSVAPLDQWYSLMIGHKIGDKLGSFTNAEGDMVRRNKPVLSNKGGENGRIYTGPERKADAPMRVMPDKAPEPEQAAPPPIDPNASPVQQAIARQKANPIDTGKYMSG